jgi:hypothetical protein
VRAVSRCCACRRTGARPPPRCRSPAATRWSCGAPRPAQTLHNTLQMNPAHRSLRGTPRPAPALRQTLLGSRTHRRRLLLRRKHHRWRLLWRPSRQLRPHPRPRAQMAAGPDRAGGLLEARRKRQGRAARCAGLLRMPCHAPADVHGRVCAIIWHLSMYLAVCVSLAMTSQDQLCACLRLAIKGGWQSGPAEVICKGLAGRRRRARLAWARAAHTVGGVVKARGAWLHCGRKLRLGARAGAAQAGG